METLFSRLYTTQQEELSTLKKNLKGYMLTVSSLYQVILEVNCLSNADSVPPWRNIDGTIKAVVFNNPQSINGVLRNTQMIHLHHLSDYYTSYGHGFIHLLNAQSIYLHCPNLGHFSSIGVRGESTIHKTNTCIFIIRLPNF